MKNSVLFGFALSGLLIAGCNGKDDVEDTAEPAGTTDDGTTTDGGTTTTDGGTTTTDGGTTDDTATDGGTTDDTATDGGTTDDTGTTGTTGTDGYAFATDDASAYTRVDRAGMPAINTAVISSKDAYNAADPVDDANGDFVPEIIASLTSCTPRWTLTCAPASAWRRVRWSAMAAAPVLDRPRPWSCPTR